MLKRGCRIYYNLAFKHRSISSHIWNGDVSRSESHDNRVSLPNEPNNRQRNVMDLQSVRERLKHLNQSLNIQQPAVAKKEAAVLVPLFQDECNIVRVILTQRSANLRNHPGEVALPGGKSDDDDSSPVCTALREAQEEMLLNPSTVDVVGMLPPVLSKHCLSVTPVIGMLSHHESDVLRPNPGEVDRIFDMPLHFFLEDNDRHTSEDAVMGDHVYRIHYFQYDEFQVWGLTAGIMIRVAELAFGRCAEFDVFGGGVDYSQLKYDGKVVMLKAADYDAL